MSSPITNSYVEWRDVWRKCSQSTDPGNNKIICYDTETVDKGYPDVDLTGFSLAWYEGDHIEGTYVPVGHEGSENIDKREQVLEELSDLLEDPTTTIVCHNVKYDLKVSWLFDANMAYNIYDTMVAAWMLDTPGTGTTKQRMWGKGSHGLKNLVADRLGYEMQDLTDLADKEDGVLLTHKVPVAELGEYAADDAIYTLKLREHQVKNEWVMQEDLWSVYQDLELPMIFPLADMEKWGTEINTTDLEQMGEEIKSEIDRIRKRMYQLRPVSDLDEYNPEAVQKAAQNYEELEDGDLSPYHKGQERKRILKEAGVYDTPVEEKIRDDKLRPEVIKWPDLAHKIFNPSSTHQLNEVLFEECEIEPIGEKSEKSGLYSTSSGNIEEWSDEHPIAEELHRLRILEKLDGTYIDGIQERLSDDKRVRTRYNMIISTGRLSSRDPNLQNIVKSDEFPVRRAFVGYRCNQALVNTRKKNDSSGSKGVTTLQVDDGQVTLEDGMVKSWSGDSPPWPMFVGDYSQLELRILADVADDQQMKETFAEGIDIHSATAKKVFDLDCEIDEVREQYGKKRDEVKAVEYGCVPLDTEILTRSGWKTVHDLDIGDETLGLNQDNDTLSWTPIIDIATYDNAPVVEIGNSYWSAQTTPNHRWYGYVRRQTGHRGPRKHVREEFTTEEITSEYSILRSARLNDEDKSRLSPVEAQVIGWLFSDGTLSWSNKDRNKKEGVHATIYQQKYRGDVAATLTKANLNFTLCKDGRTFYLHSEGIRNLLNRACIQTKEDLPDLVRKFGHKQVTAFLDAVYLAEGHTQDGQVKITQNEGPMADAIELAAFMSGYYVSRQKHSDECIKLHLGRAKVTGQRLETTEQGNKSVWCPKTKLGSWVARQKGQIFLTGNTLYGAGPAKIAGTIGVSEDEAGDIIDNYMGQFPGVSNWIDKQHQFVKDKGYVRTLAGRKRHLPGALVNPWSADDPEKRKELFEIRGAAERRSVNTPIQGSAADIINKAMVDVRDYFIKEGLWGNEARMLVQVHDEMIMEFHPRIANKMADKTAEIMENSFKLSIPLEVDYALGWNWHQTKI